MLFFHLRHTSSPNLLVRSQPRDLYHQHTALLNVPLALYLSKTEHPDPPHVPLPVHQDKKVAQGPAWIGRKARRVCKAQDAVVLGDPVEERVPLRQPADGQLARRLGFLYQEVGGVTIAQGFITVGVKINTEGFNLRVNDIIQYVIINRQNWLYTMMDPPRSGTKPPPRLLSPHYHPQPTKAPSIVQGIQTSSRTCTF